MKNIDLASLEDLILNFYTEANADHENAVLTVQDLQADWRKTELRDSDFVRGLSALCESGMCRPIRDEHGLAVQLTGLGASYLRSNRSLLGLKPLAGRRVLSMKVNRLRKEKPAVSEHTSHRHDDRQPAAAMM